MEQDILQISVQLSSLLIFYDYKDWESILQSAQNEIPKPVDRVSLTSKLPWVEVKINTELYDSSLVIKLPDAPEASCGVAHMKFSLNTVLGIN